MATGSSNMTTYKASQVIGNDSAQNPAGALLQSGAGRADNSTTGDTWIFLDTYSGTASPWGIKHSQGDDKIKIIGNNTDGFWVTMNTGDTYILGKVGIGYDPETSGNTYKLYVNGTSYFNGNTTHNGIDYFANGTTYYINNSGNANLLNVNVVASNGYTIDNKGAIWHNGTNLWIGAKGTDTDVFTGNLYLNGGLNSNSKRNRVAYLSLGASDDATTGTNYPIVHKDATGSSTNGIYLDSNGKTIAMTYSLSATVNAASVKNTFAYYSGTNAISSYPRIRNIGSARYPIDIYVYNDAGNLISEMWYDAGDATNVTKGQWNFLSESPNSTNNTGTTGKYEYFYLPNVDTGRTSNASYAIRTSKSSAYNVDTATHLSSAPNNTTTFYRGDKTWTNVLGGAFQANGTITANGGYLKSTCNSVTVQIGGQNNGCCHFYINENVPFAFNRGFIMVNNGYIGNSSYPTGDIVVKASGRISGNGGALYLGNANNASWVYIQDVASQDNSKWKLHTNGNAEFTGTVGTGAINANGDLNLYTSSADSPDIVWWYANKGKEQARLWMGSGFSSKAAPNFREYKSDGTSLYSGVLPLGDGTGASGSWGISVTGSSASCTGNAATATRINGNLGAITDANGHNIWVSSGSGGDGIPKIVSGCYVQPSTCTIVATKVKNAVWNDYAECRIAATEEPGRCVTETQQGKMVLTTTRLQAGCKLTSDTYGTLMGETEQAKTPIAVAGRVLVYPYRPREEYPLGAAVCSAPNGTVDIMTRDEIMMYPERIVGTVSEIPDYDVWNCGSKEAPTTIKVNGRIWIYVK